MVKGVAAGVGEQVEAGPAVDVSPDNVMESSIQWPCGKHSQRGNKLPLFHFFPSNFLQRHPLQWSRKLRSFCLSWRSPTLLGVAWVIGRAQPHHQMWRLLSVCGWRNRAGERAVFLIVTVRGAFHFPKPSRCRLYFDSYWLSKCVSMMQDLCFEASATSKPPPYFFYIYGNDWWVFDAWLCICGRAPANLPLSFPLELPR